MSNTYLDPYDTDAPPHVAGAEGGIITENDDRDTWSPGQRQLASWFEAGAVAGLAPPDMPIDPLAPLLGFIHKLAVDREQDDFRYLIYGRAIAKHANMGMEGRFVSELVEPARSLFLTHYRDLVARPRLFVGQVVYRGTDVRYSTWPRGVAPLGTSQTGVTHFIVFTEAAGTEPRR